RVIQVANFRSHARVQFPRQERSSIPILNGNARSEDRAAYLQKRSSWWASICVASVMQNPGGRPTADFSALASSGSRRFARRAFRPDRGGKRPCNTTRNVAGDDHVAALVLDLPGNRGDRWEWVCPYVSGR